MGKKSFIPKAKATKFDLLYRADAVRDCTISLMLSVARKAAQFTANNCYSDALT